jgi:hypothetical protein
MTVLYRCVLVALILMLGLLLPSTSSAQTPVKSSEAAAVAANWLRLGQDMNWGWDASASTALQPRQELLGNGETVAYCFPVSCGGYIVVPAFTELSPITAYSTTSTLNPALEDGFPALLKESLQKKLELVRSVLNSSKPQPEWISVQKEIELDRTLWAAYASSYTDFTQVLAITGGIYNTDPRRERGRYSIDDMLPLTTTVWHQSAPYNNFCPMGDGGRTVVGCVATAAAQILAYWQYPVNGIGTHSFDWNGDQSCGGTTTGATLTATYTDTYDWANTPDRCRTTDSLPRQNAVAELCYEVAVAVNMDFGRCGSGAYTGEVVNTFPNVFGYSRDIDREDRVMYSSASAWFAMLQEELNLNRPMQYRIASHSIVCDAWRVAGTQQVHMNYGWDDSHTAWYTVDNLYCNWSGCTPQVEYVVRRIHPNIVASINVTAPDGGEIWAVGETHSVTWTSAGISGDLRIELNRSYPNGAWEVIAAAAPNTGLFEWQVTAPACSTARARVSSLENPGVIDLSDHDFTAAYPAPTVVITSDSAGNILLTWTDVGAPYYKVLCSANSSGPFETLLGSTTTPSFIDPAPLADLKFYQVLSSSIP